MRGRREFIGLAILGALARPRAVGAQTRKVSRIGVLSPFTQADGPASLARPGGNVTGSTFLSEETVGKLLQLLKEVVPRASRVAIVSNPANPVYVSMLKDVEVMGRQLNIQVVRLGIQGPGDVDAMFDSARRERLDGLVVMRDFVLITYRERLVELAAKARMPVMYGMREFVDAGGLVH